MRFKRIPYLCTCLALLLAVGGFPPAALAAETEDAAVLSVIAQLEAIDTLQEIQNQRSTYTVKNAHYDTGTTNAAIIAEHEAARAGYETYVNEMFAARAAAQQAYDALTAAQKAQIDSSLVAKLSNYLPTVVHTGTFPVTPDDDEYVFETVKGGTGYGYEVSNYMVSGQIPQTFILVDTSNGETSWTPSGTYVYGESNYEVAYCCDVQTALAYNNHYKRINLEDSNYYGPSASQHIRAILQNAYPFITLDEMKENLLADGMDEEFVNSLSRSDVMSAIQMAVWTYANAGDGASEGLGYFASVDIPKNSGIYFYPLHDFTNECWEWLPGKRQRSFDARAEYRVNTLAYYLCMLPGVEAEDDQIVISDVKVARAELLPNANNSYQVGMYVYLNHAGTPQDHLKVTVTSYRTSEDGSMDVTSRVAQLVEDRSVLQMSVRSHSGDTISVVVEGTQELGRGVYFYEPVGGRDASQCLVGVAEGTTHVRAEETFLFEENLGEMGLRIYKTATETGDPLSDITFTIYDASSVDGGSLSEMPTEEDVAEIATPENEIGSVTTDATGYAGMTLEAGVYLVVEEHNEEKVVAPVDPFYLVVPMNETVENEDGTTTVETIPIVPLYPKNEPVPPPEDPPILPPVPDNVTGQFQILKYDAVTEAPLSGAEFQVYRAATPDDLDPVILLCNGLQYAAVPVLVDEEPLLLTTDETGYALSPALSCGTYFIMETKAPAGYNLATEGYSVTVNPTVVAGISTVEVPNQSGSMLPSTGGTGTVGYTASGLLLILTACALLRKRRTI